MLPGNVKEKRTPKDNENLDDDRQEQTEPKTLRVGLLNIYFLHIFVYRVYRLYISLKMLTKYLILFYTLPFDSLYNYYHLILFENQKYSLTNLNKLASNTQATFTIYHNNIPHINKEKGKVLIYNLFYIS